MAGRPAATGRLGFWPRPAGHRLRCLRFARTGEWRDPAANIRQGCTLLTDARAILRRRTVLHGRALLRAALAAYNCGIDNVLHAVRQGYDLDFYTSGRDYSRDVVNRAGFFQAHGWD